MKRRTKQTIGWILAVIFMALFFGVLTLAVGWIITLLSVVITTIIVASIGVILSLIDPPTTQP